MGNKELEKLGIEHIRIYEAFEKKEKCALCRCIENFENQVLNSISTDLVMDLDFFPKFGVEYTFCDYHMSKMESMRDKLGMAIMLKKLVTLEIRRMESGEYNSKGTKLFMKKSNDKKCFVCEKVNLKALKNDIEITLDLWRNIESFRENFREQQCFCFKHNKLLTNAAKEKFNKRDFEVFKEEIINVQMKYCKELENDLEWFINKFDYRYANEPWYNAKDSIYRAREILRRDNI